MSGIQYLKAFFLLRQTRTAYLDSELVGIVVGIEDESFAVASVHLDNISESTRLRQLEVDMCAHLNSAPSAVITRI